MPNENVLLLTSFFRIALVLGIASPLGGCALVQKGPMKNNGTGSYDDQTLAYETRQARERAMKVPADVEAATAYAAAVEKAASKGLRDSTPDWDWNAIFAETFGGIDRNCPAAAPPNGCAAALTEEARLYWMLDRHDEALAAARRAVDLEATLASAAVFLDMNKAGSAAIAVCDKVKDAIRALPKEKRVAWFGECAAHVEGGVAAALPWLTPVELREAKASVVEAQKGDQRRNMIRQASEYAHDALKRAVLKHRRWNLLIQGHCQAGMFLSDAPDPWADGGHYQPIGKETAFLAVEPGSVLWIFDGNKEPVGSWYAVVDDHSTTLSVSCGGFQIK